MATEFAEHLAAFRADLTGDYVAVVEAQRFVDQLKHRDPEALAAWMESNAVDFVRVALTRSDRRDRSRALNAGPRRAFAEAAASKDAQGLSLFATAFVIDPENTRRPLAEMVGADCEFVAAGYETTGNHALAVGAFFRALGQKAGRDQVKTVLAESECERLLRSFVGSTTPNLALAA